MDNETEKKKSGRGGKRAGAGRKKGARVYKHISIVGTVGEVSTIKTRAKEAEKTVSRYIIEGLGVSEK